MAFNSTLSFVDGFGGGSQRNSRRPSKESAASASVRSSYRSGSTLLQQGVGIFATNRSDISYKEAERLDAKKRRGEYVGSTMSMYDFVDHETEEVFKKIPTDTHWLFDTCGVHKAQSRDDNLPTARGKGDDGGARSFGLPDFEELGFVMAPPEETYWNDFNVPLRLGLQLAVNRKSSTKRLCFAQMKSKVPLNTGKEQMQSLVRNVKRCDHPNIARCHEVCEDDEYVYFLYEHLPCVTLQSILETHEWTQGQVVNLVREIIAAVGFASSMGMNHLGLSLSHVLLPANNLDEDPSVAKVFGFGLMGAVHTDASDIACWAPEALEMYSRSGEAFVNRMDTPQKNACDLWGTGAIIYSIIARRPPIVGTREMVMKMIMSKKWSFNVAFDNFDHEAKELVESLMQSNPAKRAKADGLLFNPWIRRRWRPPPNGSATFDKLDIFCNAPLPKKLFGRFLVRFLDADQLRTIAHEFYSLDSQGDGVIDAKDLRIAAKGSERAHHSVHNITSWMCADGSANIPLSRFAECFAEDVIDGAALRHAFESLDDDGSECISAQELFDALSHYDPHLTLDDVLHHIAEAEGTAEKVSNAGSPEKTQFQEPDHKLDFQEFVQLFPVRLQRLRVLDDRVSATKTSAAEKQGLFQSVQGEAEDWMKTLKAEKKEIAKLSVACIDKTGPEAVKELKKHCSTVAQILAHPPGPTDLQTHLSVFHQDQKRKKKVAKAGKNAISKPAGEYGFDSFLQDHAIHSFWPVLLDADRRELKHSVHPDTYTGIPTIDYVKASDAAQNVCGKIDEVLEWSRAQYEEYSSFLEVLSDLEAPMPGIGYSGRGLQSHGGDDDELEDGDDAEMFGDENHRPGFFGRLIKSISGSPKKGSHKSISG